MHRSSFVRRIAIGAGLAAIVSAWLAIGPVPQDPSYHVLVDQRVVFGIPNGLDVLSNLPFAAVGLLGLVMVARDRGTRGMFVDRWDGWPYAALFLGTLLTAFGSAWYHLAPDNARLVWDRLLMTLGFMGLLTAVVSERAGVRVGQVLFLPSVLFGAASVVYWYWTELHGVGDLRPYGLVQFGSLLAVMAVVARRPGRAADAGYLWGGLAAYGVAKGFEVADAAIYSFGNVVSGHTLKHLAAAAAVGCIGGMLHARRPDGRNIPRRHLSAAPRSTHVGRRSWA